MHTWTNLLIREEETCLQHSIKWLLFVFFVLCRVLDGLFKLSSELFGIIIKVCLKASFNLKVVVVEIVNVDVEDIVFLAGAWKNSHDFATVCNFSCTWQPHLVPALHVFCALSPGYTFLRCLSRCTWFPAFSVYIFPVFSASYIFFHAHSAFVFVCVVSRLMFFTSRSGSPDDWHFKTAYYIRHW